MSTDTQGAGDHRSGNTKQYKIPDCKDEKQMDHTDVSETDGDKKIERLRREKINVEKHLKEDKEHREQDKEHLEQDKEHLKQDDVRVEQDEERKKEIDDKLKEAQSKCGKRGK